MESSSTRGPPPGLGFDAPSTSQSNGASTKSSGAPKVKKPSHPRRRSTAAPEQQPDKQPEKHPEKSKPKRKPKPPSNSQQERPEQPTTSGKSSGAKASKPHKKRQQGTPIPTPAAATNGTSKSTKSTTSKSALPSASRSRSKKASNSLYPEYLKLDALVTGLENGALFRAKLRCNPGDRTQGFCTVPGLPYDVFIPGWKAQNRALEGDEVAIRILPVTKWRSQAAKGQEGATPQKSAISGNILPFSPGLGVGGNEEIPPTPSQITATEMVEDDSLEADGEEEEVTSRAVVGVEDGDGNGSESDEEEKEFELRVRGESSDLVASPALFPSPSGGELPVAIEQAPLGLDGVEDCEDGSEDGTSGAKTYEEEQGEDDLTMVGFLTEKLEAGALLEERTTTPARAARKSKASVEQGDIGTATKTIEKSEFAPWVGAASPAAVVSIISGLLKSEWEGYRPTAEVVGIMKRSDRRTSIVGVLKSYGPQLNLIPRDPRLPRALIKSNLLKNTLGEATATALLQEADQDGASSRTLVTGRIVAWEVSHRHPVVEIESVVGQAGGLEAEVAALLTQEHIHDDDKFTPAVLACLPATPWSISDADVAVRRDLRSSRIFSIDPPTARDLDDALSVQHMDNGLYKIGVHIADVSHFVVQGTPLDSEAVERSTSVYLVDRVIPMLPRLLCEELCSLNPGVDRLAFSIEWTMTEDGIVKDTWAGRSIIRSCGKLSYPQVQELIDRKATPDGAPPEGVVLHDGHAWSDVAKDALALHKVASAMRRRRFEVHGALRLDNVRLYFELNEEGKAIGYGVYEQKEANRLVEEFMLAANMTAARMISEAFPDKAILRRHMPPNAHKLQELATNVAKLLPTAPKLDVSSAGALQASLAALRDTVGPEVAEVVTLLCTKPMQTAQYFCTGNEEDPSYWRHYALAVEQYTHFTSPIRRYPDVLVHRLLAAALDKSSGKKGAGKKLPGTDRIAEIAAHANDRKTAAKAAQDGSLKLYLASLLLDRPGVYTAVVVGLGGSRFVDAYVPVLGCDVRVHMDKVVKGGDGALSLDWKESER